MQDVMMIEFTEVIDGELVEMIALFNNKMITEEEVVTLIQLECSSDAFVIMRKLQFEHVFFWLES